MKTLTESIINELRLSKASTGNKLERGKTFGEMTEGDTLYYYDIFARGNDVKSYKITEIKSTSWPEKCKSNNHPDELFPTIKDIRFELDKDKKIFAFSEHTWEIYRNGYDEEMAFLTTSPTEIPDILAHCKAFKKPSNLKDLLK